MNLRPFSETPDIFKELPTSPSSSFELDNNRVKPLDVSVTQASISPSSSSCCSTALYPHNDLQKHQQNLLLQENREDMTFSVSNEGRDSLPLTDVSALLFNRISQSDLSSSSLVSTTSFHPISSCFHSSFDDAMSQVTSTIQRRQQQQSLHPSQHQYCRQEFCSVFNRLHPLHPQQETFSLSSSSSLTPSSSSFQTSSFPTSSFQTSSIPCNGNNKTSWQVFHPLPSQDHHCIEDGNVSTYLTHDPSSIYSSLSLGRLQETEQQPEETMTSSPEKTILSHSLQETRNEETSSLFGLKVHQRLTTDHEHQEEDAWNQFQGSVVSSYGRRYLQSQEKKEEKRKRKTNKKNKTNCNKRKSNNSENKTRQLSSFVWKKVFPARQVFTVNPGCESGLEGLDTLQPDFPPVTLTCLSSSSSPLPPPSSSHSVKIATGQECSPVVSSTPFDSKCLNRRPFLSSHCILSCFSFTAFLLIVLLVLKLYILPDNHLRSAASLTSNGIKEGHKFRSKDFWWKESILYEIFPVSFKDSDDDGFGDLTGIRSKIPYLKDLGITGIRLSSVFSALDYPYQYDHVIDFKAVDVKIGSLHDFQLLLQDIHANDMTLVLDINPTITSDQHPWATSWLSRNKSFPSSDHSYFYALNRNVVSIMFPLTAVFFSLSSSFCITIHQNQEVQSYPVFYVLLCLQSLAKITLWFY